MKHDILLFLCPNQKRCKVVWIATGIIVLSVVLSDGALIDQCTTVSFVSVIAPLFVGFIASSKLFDGLHRFYFATLNMWKGIGYTIIAEVGTSKEQQVKFNLRGLLVIVVWYLLWQWRSVELITDMHLLPMRCTVVEECYCSNSWSYFIAFIAITIIGFLVTFVSSTVVAAFVRKVFNI